MNNPCDVDSFERKTPTSNSIFNMTSISRTINIYTTIERWPKNVAAIDYGLSETITIPAFKAVNVSMNINQCAIHVAQLYP